MQALTAIRRWFESTGHRVVDATVTDDGICTGCGAKLPPITLPPERLARLVAALRSTIIESGGQTARSFGSFERWLDNVGPVAAVVDGLNVCCRFIKARNKRGALVWSKKRLHAVMQYYRRHSVIRNGKTVFADRPPSPERTSQAELTAGFWVSLRAWIVRYPSLSVPIDTESLSPPPSPYTHSERGRARKHKSKTRARASFQHDSKRRKNQISFFLRSAKESSAHFNHRTTKK